MSLINDLLKQDRRVAAMGVRARESVRKAGVSSFYIEPASDGVVIEEKADDTHASSLSSKTGR